MDLDAVDVWAPLASRPPGREGPWWNGSFQVMRAFRATVAWHRAERHGGAAHRRVPPREPGGFPARLHDARRDDAATRGTDAGRTRPPDDRNLALTTRLAGVGVLVLIIAMANVASLLLMRALRRRREIAIRVALGVSRGRLTSQMLIESLLLAILGGVVAVLIALWTGGPLRAALLSNIRWSTTVIDTRLIAFTAAIAILAGTAAGLAPAAIALRRDIIGALKAGSSESGRSRSGLRVTLLVTQTALCMLMLAAAGMFIQSLRKARDVDLGFDADRLITLQPRRRPSAPARVIDCANRRAPFRSRREPVEHRSSRQRSGHAIRFANGDSIPAARLPHFGAIDTGTACDRHCACSPGEASRPTTARDANRSS